MKYVGLSRRLFAYVLDGFIYFSLLGLILNLLNEQSSLLSDAQSSSAAIAYITIFILYLVDQIVFPIMYGFTISRWICGYRIKRKDGNNPTIKQAVLRFFSIWFIDFLSIGIITFITYFFRKDKAAIHDIISKSYAVFPDDRRQLKYSRLSIAILSICLGSLFFMNLLVYGVHDIFIKPTKNKMLEEGHPLYPTSRVNETRIQENGLRFYGIDLIKKNSIEETSICLNKDNEFLKEYILLIGGTKFIIDYTESDLTPIPESRWEKVISFILKVDPFLDPPYIIAEKIYHNDDMNYPLFSPINNMALLIGNILYAIGAPAYSNTAHTIKGYESFTIINALFKNEYSFLSITVIRGNNMEIYGMRPQEPSVAAKDVVNRIIKELLVIDDPLSSAKQFPLCTES